MAPDLQKPPSPFKFNLDYLEDPCYLSMIRSSWIPYNPSLLESPSLQFLSNLRKVKEVYIHWNKEKKKQENKYLLNIEKQLNEWQEKEVDYSFTE
jgi:hypothetical protein